MDEIFRALADPSRRKLLDALFQEDGQTLMALQEILPMSRFGAMKHLQILERSGLITSIKFGRERRHYLNPVPIQLLYDRWVSKYAGTFTGALTRLKYELEDEITVSPATTSHSYQIEIRASPERIWQALTTGDDSVHYYYGTRVSGIETTGGDYSYTAEDGTVALAGKVVEADPPRKLVTTFQHQWNEDGGTETLVTFNISVHGDICLLSVLHECLIAGSGMAESIKSGWPHILSGLKTWLETGAPMSTNDA
jgi:uncharacterized protein YndB with AHSA1/START domain